MEEKEYIVSRIDGEYAYLKDVGGNDEELFIAMALLPPGIDVGTRLRYTFPDFEVI
ncbi:MAG: hypothetical protein IKA64_04290 [Clostridia bacterium]|nr:hypothetical protein [Clostridia bacterium]